MTTPPEHPDDLADARFSPETADYAAERAARLYPVELDASGSDINAAARAAYRRGFDDADVMAAETTARLMREDRAR